MPSKLIFHGCHISQILTDLQRSPFPLRWNKKDQNWMICGDKSSKIRQKYTLFALTWKSLLALLACSSMFQQFQNKLYFSPQKFMVAVFFFLFTESSILVDIVLFLYGNEMVACCNWLYAAERVWINVKFEKCHSLRKTPTKTSATKTGKGLIFSVLEQYFRNVPMV